MKTVIFKDKGTWKGQTLYVAQRISLKPFRGVPLLARGPLTIAVAGGCAVLFRYGAVVLFGLNDGERSAFLAEISSHVSEPLSEPESEEFEFTVDPASQEGVFDDVISLSTGTIERLQTIAVVLGKSIVLAHYESTVAKVFDEIEPLAAGMGRRGRGGRGSKNLVRQIGAALQVHHKMVGRVEVEEKPEMLWEQPELERLFLRLEEEYEIRERHRALERKLDLISHTASTLLSLQYETRTLRVEWYIVFLILIEILIYLWDLFHAG